MERTLKCLVLSLLLIVVVSTITLSQGADPFIGKWKLNVAKSKLDPGPAPKSLALTYEDRGDGVTLATVEGIDAQGNRIFVQTAAKYDGKDYPRLVLGAKAVMSNSRRRIDANTVETIIKADGKVTTTEIRTLSKDGKTMTITGKGTDEQGRQVNNVYVYERQ